MPSFQENLAKVNQARQKNAAAAEALYAAKLALQKNAGDLSSEAIQSQLADLFQAEKNSKADLDQQISQLYGTARPHDLLSQWDASIPVLLLPLRLETQMVETTQGRWQLWLRAYPDDIAVNSHEPVLSEPETAAGQQYWRDSWQAEKAGADPETGRQTAWRLLKERFGVQRGAWIARQTQPVNWKERSQLASADGLTFPKPTLTKAQEWTRAPRTQAMPDKLVAVIIKNNNVVFEQVGNPIPDTLVMGPDPFQSDAAFRKTEDGIEFAPEFAWMADFDKAIEVGMGMKINLTVDFFADPVAKRLDKIVVLGVYLSADAEGSATVLENLIESRHYTDGFSLIPQGTPTNNTETGQSGYTANEDFFEKGYYESPDDLFAANPGCDGQRLADALGVNPTVLAHINGAGQKEHTLASTANQVLFPATLGYYTDTLLHPDIPDNYAALLRSFFENQVTAAGPLAAIRIGDQPYGILPTSDFGKWKNFADTPNNNQQVFENTLYKVLANLNAQWGSLLNKVVFIGKEKDENGNALLPERVFLDVLGLQPSSIGFFARKGYLNDLPQLYPAMTTNSQYVQQAEHQATLVGNWLATHGAQTATKTFMERLLLLPDKKFPIPPENLIDGLPPSEKRGLPVIESLNLNYLQWLATVQNLDDLEKQRLGASAAPRFILYLLARQALLLELLDAALKMTTGRNTLLRRTSFDKSFVNFDITRRDLTVWELLHGKLSDIGIESPGPGVDTIGDLLLQGHSEQSEAKPIQRLRNAMGQLSGLTTAQLERLLAGHIDCLTYRLDAWQTGMFYNRLERRRQNQSKGIYLGAYGYLENLQPAPRTSLAASDLPEKLRPADGSAVFKPSDNLGVLHAPSLDHAAAAAVLMTGYHHHATQSNPGPFAVNLSSARLRVADQILEGIRNGQSLEALLGYLFERGLHDLTTSGKNLNQFTLFFRQTYPIEQLYITQQGENQAAANEPSAIVGTVVNGLKIAQETDLNKFRNIILNNAPGLPAATRNELADLAWKEKQQLEDDLDALKDLFMAESAYQAIRGNMGRTASLLDAIRDGEIPAEFEVQQTPRSKRFGFTNKICLHFNPSDTSSGAWGTGFPATARSMTEPGLNRWLGDCLGSAAQICCVAAQRQEDDTTVQPEKLTLADLNLQPIDFVYMAGAQAPSGNSELEQRLIRVYRKKRNLAAAVPVVIQMNQTGGQANAQPLLWILPIATALYGVITSGRPLHAKDYSPLNPDDGPAYAEGIDTAECLLRAGNLVKRFRQQVEHLEQIAPNDQHLPATLGILMQQWVGSGYDDSLFESLNVSNAALTEIFQTRLQLAEFAVTGAIPAETNPAFATPSAELATLARCWQSARNLLARAEQLLQEANATPDDATKISKAGEIVKILLGGAFVFIPQFRFTQPGEIMAAKAGQPQLLKFYAQKSQLPDSLVIEDWLQGVAPVRKAVNFWERVRTLVEAQTNVEWDPCALQLPFKEKDSWLAVEFPETDEATGLPFQPSADTLSCVVFGEAAFNANALQSGLLLDEWTETIPAKEETTGLTFHYNQPNAEPPQTLLLAVCPDSTETWSWNALLGTVLDTFQRAKMRAVEPKHLYDNAVVNSLLPAVIAPINVRNANFSLDFAAANPDYLEKVRSKNLPYYTPFLKRT